MLLLSPRLMPKTHKFFGLDTQGDKLEKCIDSLGTLACVLAPTSTEGAGLPVPPITPPHPVPTSHSCLSPPMPSILSTTVRHNPQGGSQHEYSREVNFEGEFLDEFWVNSGLIFDTFFITVSTVLKLPKEITWNSTRIHLEIHPRIHLDIHLEI